MVEQLILPRRKRVELANRVKDFLPKCEVSVVVRNNRREMKFEFNFTDEELTALAAIADDVGLSREGLLQFMARHAMEYGRKTK